MLSGTKELQDKQEHIFEKKRYKPLS
jgi:hypothetical protein